MHTHTHAPLLSTPGSARLSPLVRASSGVAVVAHRALAGLVAAMVWRGAGVKREWRAVDGHAQRLGRATDHADLERIERDFERRDGDRAWD